ncbi:hypothetical protein [Pseudomonas sp. TE21394]
MATNPDNGDKLLSEQALVLRVARALDNTLGLVRAAELDIHVGSLVNQKGLLEAQQGVSLTVDESLDNQQGRVLGSVATLNSVSINNSNGLLQH